MDAEAQVAKPGVSGEPIAVVGAACRLPGAAHSLTSLWRLLMARRETVREVPPERWEQAELAGLPTEVARRMRYGCFLEDDVYAYEPEFFGINEQEAPWVDPEHRLLAEVVWEAIEHAGIATRALSGTATGMFFGIYQKDYLLRVQRPLDESDAYAMYTGFDSPGPGRVGFLLNLRGPQLTVETACSSGLVAVHTACQSLRTGESDVALAGGVMLALGPEGVASPALWGVFSPTGRSRAYDADADGYVRGEGCGVVVLKRLSDAMRDQDRILALLRGTAVNQNGRGTRLSAPSESAQIDVYRLALERAGVDAGSVGMVEGHGPGTAVGDPIEFAAVAAVYGKGLGRCALGSVKTNIGHTEPVSGVAGLLKAIASVQHGLVPASLHFRRWNPQMDPTGTRLFVPTETTEWPVRGSTRLAAVSSFGISGTNAHVIVEQAPARSHRVGRRASSSAPTRSEGVQRVFALSAGTPAAVRACAGRLARWLRGEGARTPLADVAHTLAVRRSPTRERAGVVAADRPTLVARLQELESGTAGPGVAVGRAVPDLGPGVVWVFSGHGSQWAGMCQGLLDRDLVFTRVIEEVEPLVAAESGISVRQLLSRPDVVTGFDRVQPVILAIQLGLAAMWRSHGVEPAAVIGHSMGEVAAAVASGALSVEDGVRVICRRSGLILRAAGRGLMASVALGRADVEALLAEQDVRGVTVAVVASPETTVIGGDADRIRELAREWEADGIGIRVVEVDVASHTAHMDPILPPLADALAGVSGTMPAVTFYSTVTDDPRAAVSFDAAYWADNLRRVVRFADAVRVSAEDGHRLFVEIGPHPVLTQPIQATLAAHGHTATSVVPSLTRGVDDALAFHTSVAALHCAGHPLDWESRYGNGLLVDVPPTTWDRKRYVIGPSPLRRPAGPHPLTGPHTVDLDGEGRHLWQTRICTTTLPWLADHHVNGVVVLPGAAMCEMAIAAATDLFATGPAGLRLTDISLDRLLLLSKEGTAVTATAEVHAPGRARWRLAATDSDGTTIDHARAQLHHLPGTEPVPQREDLRQLQARFPQSLSASEIYAHMRERRGVHHGPAFTGLEALHTDGLGHDRLLARVKVPDDGRASARTLHWHPVSLDTCLQAVAAAWLHADAIPEGGILPRRIAELRLYGPVPLSGHCLVTLGQVEGDRYTADFRLWADDGTLAADAAGVEFRHVPAVSENERFAQRLFQAVWEPVERPVPKTASGSWTVLAETGREQYATELGQALELHGVTAEVRVLDPVGPGDDGDGDGVAAALAPLTSKEGTPQAVVYLPAAGGTSVDASPAEEARRRVARLLEMARYLTAEAADGRGTVPRLWVVTRTAQQVRSGDRPDLGQAGLRGLVRVLSYEHPELRPSVLDTDPTTPARDVAAELLACPDEEDEVAHRQGTRHVARLRNTPMVDEERHRRTVNWRRDRATLHLARTGDLDSFELVSQQHRRPGRGEIEVQLAATSVNFVNVLQAMGVYQRFTTDGDEADSRAFDGTGIVTEVGEGVHDVQPGDRVAAVFLDSDMSSFAITRADCTLALPEHLGLHQAAGLPCAYLTAWYALRHVARLRPEEQVLIHSASGGTGLAAVNIARACGARVLATAGSEAKRAYLRDLGIPHVMDSRTLDFADQVRAVTEGRGVDVVLNSLTGPAQAAGLDLLARQGRFVEIGKRDIYANTRLGMLPFRRNITLASVDLLLLMRTDPDLLAVGFRELTGMLADGTLPPLPTTGRPIDQAAASFRTMASAEHIGKLVLTWPTEGTTRLPVRPQDVTTVRADGCYLITGGLGGLGLLVAGWLAERGAGALVLVSRTAPDSSTLAALDTIRARGTGVDVVSGDIAEPGVADALVRTARATGHRLRGVVHAAAVVEDATIANLSPALLETVWRPKATGAWLLHHALGDEDLDWWICFSSAASLLGNAGQGAYAAANAWLDEFTSWRRAQGLPATCINWGPWADVGRGAVMEQRGYTMITPAEGIDALERVLMHDRSRTAYTPADLPRWLESYPATSRLAFFAAMAGCTADAGASDASSDLLRALDEAEDAQQRNQQLQRLVVEHIAAVLHVGADRFDADTSLVTLGLDSLMAIALRNRLQRDTALEIPTTVMWTHPTAAALTGYLIDRLYSSEG